MAGFQQGGVPDRASRAAALAAGIAFVAALAGFGAALEGYDHGDWPVALLGASGVPRAAAFNAVGYVLPGLLAAFVALRRRARLSPGAGMPVRLGLSLLLLAAVAFAAQGVLPLDPAGPDAGRGRLHGVAWALWSLAFAAAAMAFAIAAAIARSGPDALLHLGAALLVLVPAWPGSDLLSLAVGQRLAYAIWFCWLVRIAWARLPAMR